MLKRLRPVVLLALLSPLIAEFVSGSMSLREIGALPVLILMYGCGAILIREVARRTRRGWPCIFLLALAYGLIEEGIADQTLFNPHFHGLRLLDYGWISPLGIGVPWTIYVLGIHIVWSIAVPIALAERAFPGDTPWLGRIGLGVVAFFVPRPRDLDGVFRYFIDSEHFCASPPQLVIASIAALVSIIAAFTVRLPRAFCAQRRARWCCLSWVWSARRWNARFGLLYAYIGADFHPPWPLIALGMLGLFALVLSFLARHSLAQTHLYAIAAGAFLTYCWSGFFTEVRLHGPDDVGRSWRARSRHSRVRRISSAAPRPCVVRCRDAASPCNARRLRTLRVARSLQARFQRTLRHCTVGFPRAAIDAAHRVVAHTRRHADDSGHRRDASSSARILSATSRRLRHHPSILGGHDGVGLRSRTRERRSALLVWVKIAE